MKMQNSRVVELVKIQEWQGQFLTLIYDDKVITQDCLDNNLII